jgi:hypothetical protein
MKAVLTILVVIVFVCRISAYIDETALKDLQTIGNSEYLSALDRARYIDNMFRSLEYIPDCTIEHTRRVFLS